MNCEPSTATLLAIGCLFAGTVVLIREAWRKFPFRKHRRHRIRIHY